MRISIEDIRAFVLVTELGSFSKAAETLTLTQSALSRRLKKLEEALGARLLDRTSQSIELTAVGEEFRPTANQMVRDYERSVSEIRDVIEKRAGVVSMASVMTISHNVLPPVIKRFADRHPAVRIRVIDDVGPKTAEFVSSGEAEFGIVLEAGEYTNLDFIPIVEDPYVLACHADHPLARKPTARWADLQDYPYIRMGKDTGNQRQLAGALDGTNLMPQAAVEVQHISTIMGFLGADLGVTAVPRLAVAQRPDLDLAFRPLIEPEVSRHIGIVKIRGRTLSPAAEALQEMVAEELRRLSKQIVIDRPSIIRSAKAPEKRRRPGKQKARS